MHTFENVLFCSKCSRIVLFILGLLPENPNERILRYGCHIKQMSMFEAPFSNFRYLQQEVKFLFNANYSCSFEVRMHEHIEWCQMSLISRWSKANPIFYSYIKRMIVKCDDWCILKISKFVASHIVQSFTIWYNITDRRSLIATCAQILKFFPFALRTPLVSFSTLHVFCDNFQR